MPKNTWQLKYEHQKHFIGKIECITASISTGVEQLISLFDLKNISTCKNNSGELLSSVSTRSHDAIIVSAIQHKPPVIPDVSCKKTVVSTKRKITNTSSQGVLDSKYDIVVRQNKKLLNEKNRVTAELQLSQKLLVEERSHNKETSRNPSSSLNTGLGKIILSMCDKNIQTKD